MAGPTVIALHSDQAEAAATLHRACFPVGWSAQGFHEFLSQPDVYGFGICGDRRELAALALARSISGEAEVLTLATAPHARRRRLAWAVLHAVIAETWRTGADRLVLEVSVGNEAALALYRRLGFTEIGVRRDYYATKDKQDALVMALERARWTCRNTTAHAGSCPCSPEA